MHRRWFVNKTNPEFVRYLSRNASVSPILAQVLINRGLKTVADIRNFLNPEIRDLSDPFLLPDMGIAVGRIISALRAGEKVFVYGDYDADGLTATAIMVHALRKAGLDVHYGIPNRTIHGYGFNPGAVDTAKKFGAGLIITVDTGISSFEAVAAARAEGIDVIITDHHEPVRNTGVAVAGSIERNGLFLPPAVAVVNPKTESGEGGLSILSGAGVAFKLAQALAMDEGVNVSMDDALSLLDLAALGTMADVVPLTGENRIILREGVNRINNGTRSGIRALRDVCGLSGREISSRLLSFTLVPRINAAGRIDDPADVVRLLLSDDDEETRRLGLWLDTLNTERQKIEEEVYREAVSQLREKESGPVIVLYGEGWHQGVLGIVASRLVEEYSVPAFILSIEKGIAKGSARSVPAFDICRGLEGCRDLILTFGGHRQAAGLRLNSENIEKFREMMAETVRKTLDGRDLKPSLEIDADVNLSDITFGLMRELAMLEPFGQGNTEPLFGSKSLEVFGPRLVGAHHLKLKLKKNAVSLDTIGFTMGHFLEHLSAGSRVDAVFTPVINEWNGGRSLQLMLKACRPSV
jgi:single-stranded-DNA-specific exonuclease